MYGSKYAHFSQEVKKSAPMEGTMEKIQVTCEMEVTLKMIGGK